MDGRMVVGLGNPGRRYEQTPHNAGFLVVDRLAEKAGIAWRRSWRVSAHCAAWNRAEGVLLLVKPATFMNASGNAVEPLLRKRGWTADRVIVVLDDADLPLGSIRVRSGGGAGGHRGLQSVLERLGTNAVARVRIGIGRQSGVDLVEQVLAPFGPAEWELAGKTMDLAAEAVISIADCGVEKTMNRFNQTITDGRSA